MATKTLTVPEISCGHCKASIEQAVSQLSGVTSVEVEVDDRAVNFEYDGTDATFDAIVAAIEAAGYEVPAQV
ncbi:MAG: copper ion binding protein [Actinomycetota bacterium]